MIESPFPLQTPGQEPHSSFLPVIVSGVSVSVWWEAQHGSSDGDTETNINAIK